MPAGARSSTRAIVALPAALGVAHQRAGSWWLPITGPRGTVGASWPSAGNDVAIERHERDRAFVGPRLARDLVEEGLAAAWRPLAFTSTSSGTRPPTRSRNSAKVRMCVSWPL